MHLHSRSDPEPTPICRCRVLYLGSAVPHVTKDGLQGIQEPLRELYPEQGALGARGIDSWLSVWYNGLLLENVDENYKKVTRFFPIDSLHYCAAVRYVLVPEKLSPGANSQPRFLPLDSPFARSPNPNHPPLFAAILRRTTGIKVLECHTFICKREVAANALVRCCFHAYADFSYIRQTENGGVMTPLPGAGGAGSSQLNGGGSLYGTLCNGQPMASNSIEKVEGWRRTQPSTVNGSMLTLNSAVQTSTPNGNRENEANGTLELSNSADDVSVYNGNENHKVWAGSNRDLTDKEALYGECSTMRSLRSNRPRQITNAVPPPPPPPSIVNKEDKSKKIKDRSRRKKLSEGSRDDIYCNGGGNTLMKAGPASMMNGYAKAPSSISGGTVMRAYPPSKVYPPLNGGIYSNGTILRPATSMNGFHPIHGPVPHPAPMMMMPTTLPHPPRRISTGSYNKVKHAPILVPVPRHLMPSGAGPVPPNFVSMIPQPIYMQTTARKLSKNQIPIAIPVPPPMAVAKEEPIYMPSARPMSPIASYQPAHFPHDAYLMQQYASTADVKTKKKKNKTKKETNGQHPPVPMATRTSHSSLNHRNHGNGDGAGDDGDDDDDLGEADSTYNTGIYKRKGHLNERAFSYSIRQEHRSRSYGSLANLKFAPPPVVPNGVNKEEIKKEREIMQMMHDLELSGDELERSEVPSGIYQPAKTKSNKIRR